MAGDAVEHVGEVEEYYSLCWWKVSGHWCGDVFLDLELHDVNDEVHSIRDANSVVKWEHVLCKHFFECLSDVCHHELMDDCSYAKVGGVLIFCWGLCANRRGKHRRSIASFCEE